MAGISDSKPDRSEPAPFNWPMWALELVQVAPSAPQARKGIESVFRQYRPLMAERDRLRAENEALKAERDDKLRRLEPDGAGGFRWESADLNAQLTWLRNQMGDVRGMQSDGATPEEMDHALGRALAGQRARYAFDVLRSRASFDEIKLAPEEGTHG